MAVDSGLIIPVDFDTTKAEAKQRKLNREMDISRQKAENINSKIQELNTSLEDEKNKQKEIRDQISEQTKEAALLAQKIDKVKSGNATMQEIIDLGSLDAAESKLKEMETAIIKTEQAFDKSAAAEKKITAEIAKQNLNLKKQNATTANIGDQILLNGKKQNKFTQAFEKSQKSADRFAKRIKSLIASALFFSVVTKAFTALREEFGKLITETGTRTASLVAQLKSNLATIGRTLYEGAKPYIEWLLEKLAMITQLLAEAIAKALGKDINQMRKLANSTDKVAENAERTEKATASFDTLQKIDTSSIGATSENSLATATGATTFTDEELAKTKDTLDTILDLVGAIAVGLTAWKLTDFLSELGLIQNKTKTLGGLFISILGTIMFIQTYSDAWTNGIDWENFIMLIGSLALTVGGLGLAFGIVGTGIGLILGGILLVVLGIKDMVENGINGKNLLTVAVGAISIAFGILLIKTKSVSGALKALFSPTGWLAIGIAVLVAGIAYLAQNWDKLSPAQRTITILGSLTAALVAAAVAIALFHTSWSVGVAAAAIVAGIALLGGTYLFKTANKKGISTDLSKSGAAPASISQYSKYANMSNPIPALATGAILPGGSPMLAWVNDQPKGQPYIEGSVENIAKAFEKYLGDKGFGNQNLTIEAKGSMAQFIRMLNLKIKQENTRATIF